MTVDAQVMLDRMQLQLVWLERELAILRQVFAQQGAKTPPRTFESLRGIWTGVVINEEDFEASRLTLPESL